MDESVSSERWLPVVGYEGWYEVSDQGRVRSLDRWTSANYGGRRYWRGCLLKPMWSGKYYVVGLHRLGTRGNYFVHVLVAEAFIGPRPAGAEVRHGPGGPRDNRASSLCYGTKSENSHDRRRDGTNHHLNKDRCTLGHLYQEPNLVPSAWKRGQRDCLACNRARAIIYRHYTRLGLPPGEDLQVVADRYYANLMSDTAA